MQGSLFPSLDIKLLAAHDRRKTSIRDTLDQSLITSEET